MLVTSLEFAHFYPDFSIKELRRHLQVVKDLNLSPAPLCLMIDDYNSNNDDYLKELVTELEREGLKLDYVLYESKLTQICDHFYKSLPSGSIISQADLKGLCYFYKRGRNKIKLKTKTDTGYRYSCSLLTAVWLLVRLGEMAAPEDSFHLNFNSFHASDLAFSILSEKFAVNEERALLLLKESTYRSACERINYLFLESDNEGL